MLMLKLSAVACTGHESLEPRKSIGEHQAATHWPIHAEHVKVDFIRMSVFYADKVRAEATATPCFLGMDLGRCQTQTACRGLRRRPALEVSVLRRRTGHRTGRPQVSFPKSVPGSLFPQITASTCKISCPSNALKAAFSLHKTSKVLYTMCSLMCRDCGPDPDQPAFCSPSSV